MKPSEIIEDFQRGSLRRVVGHSRKTSKTMKKDIYDGPGEKSQGKIVKLCTLCKRCKGKVECEWPEECSWGGLSVSPQEYMALAINGDSVGVFCDECLQSMPDVRMSDIRWKDICDSPSGDDMCEKCCCWKATRVACS